MAAGYDRSIFKNRGAIYNNFWHEKWICYDKRASKIRGQYILKNMLTNKKEKSIMKLQKRN